MPQPLQVIFQPDQPVGRLTPEGCLNLRGTRGRLVFWDRRTTAGWQANCSYRVEAYHLVFPATKECCFFVVERAVRVPSTPSPLMPARWRDYVFSAEQLGQLSATGELEKPIRVMSGNQTDDWFFVASIREDNSLRVISSRQVILPAQVAGVTLNAEQRQRLRAGERVRLTVQDQCLDVRFSPLRNGIVTQVLSTSGQGRSTGDRSPASKRPGEQQTGQFPPPGGPADEGEPTTEEQIRRLREAWGVKPKG